MRRLLLLVSALVLVDTMLYAALTPLLPHFADELGLSKARAGVLVGAYAAGALVGGLPGGFAAARLGPRRAVLGGLTLMTVSSLVFAFGGSFWPLFAARFVQGGGSAFTWAGAFGWLVAAAPRERRGELLGTAMGVAVFGALFGPVLGAAAALLGRGTVFASVGVLAAALAAWTLRVENAPAEAPSHEALRRALRDRRFLGGLAVMSLPALLFGVLSVLGPLHLAAAGWGPAAIGAVWLVSAGVESLEGPLVGRLSDRRGRALPVRISLVAGAVVSVGLALAARPLLYVPLIVLAALAYGILFTPALALIADGAEAAGLAQGMGFGMMNAAWAVGAVVGPAAGGAVAAVAGDSLPFALTAAICGLSLVLVSRPRRSEHERAAVLVDRLPGDPARVGRQ